MIALRPCPDAGRYRKIDVYAKPRNADALVYLHSTNAYPTLRQAIIGAALAFKQSKTKDGHRVYEMTVYDCNGGGYASLDFDPYSVIAQYSDRKDGQQ